MTTHQTMGAMFDQLEAELIKQFRTTTPEQLAAENQRRKVKAEYEAKHTAIETDEDRANTDEYPTEDDTE